MIAVKIVPLPAGPVISTPPASAIEGCGFIRHRPSSLLFKLRKLYAAAKPRSIAACHYKIVVGSDVSRSGESVVRAQRTPEAIIVAAETRPFDRTGHGVAKLRRVAGRCFRG